ncbi:hypothetical protein niasHT_005144 [Heterodera trifolii]|uniref:Secreted protein n=1 Tax=Heterodera trifolii TaxID=157864 RepID=A0ABD2LRN3_9BILA
MSARIVLLIVVVGGAFNSPPTTYSRVNVSSPFLSAIQIVQPSATFHRTNKRTLSSHKQQQQKVRRRHEKRQLSISYSAQFANHRRTVSQEKKL